MSFLREVFSEDGQGSFSRVASGFHTIGVLSWISHFVWIHGAIPDSVTMLALGGFATVHYAANKTANAISTFGTPGSKI